MAVLLVLGHLVREQQLEKYPMKLKIKLYIYFLLSFLLFASFSYAQINKEYEYIWTKLLQQYVHDGYRKGIELTLVDYAGLKKDGRFQLLLDELQMFDIEELQTKEEKIAFWSNVYNIGATKMIIDHWPPDSIRAQDFLFFSVWKIKIINVGGKIYNLHTIEHNILRKLDEPRIHFTIVCASLSCPNLRKEAYAANRIEEQMEEQTVEFLNNNTKGLRVDIPKRKIHLSKIFDWFAEDFGNVREFLAKYYPKYSQQILNKNYKFNYMHYDWSLNNWKTKNEI